jgi:LPPG:FO 2-phospho-L-lactate transferase
MIQFALVTPPASIKQLRVAALAGGVGGAKLAHGLATLLPPENLSIIVNTGDDFEHLGLKICPDLDTVLYTLAGRSNPTTGWGLTGDTFNVLDALGCFDAPTWFRLGDCDLATHLWRSELLRRGMLLTKVTNMLSHALGVRQPILPMCDMPMPTRILTDQGEMDFQVYFVQHACRPAVRAFHWPQVGNAKPSAEVIAALDTADVVVFCPSNPFVSIDPILMLPGVRERVNSRLSIAVSPILDGVAVKGPAAKMFSEVGIKPSAQAVASHYAGLLKGFILDKVDEAQIAQVRALGMEAAAIPTLMPGLLERTAVAQYVLEFALHLL